METGKLSFAVSAPFCIDLPGSDVYGVWKFIFEWKAGGVFKFIGLDNYINAFRTTHECLQH